MRNPKRKMKSSTTKEERGRERERGRGNTTNKQSVNRKRTRSAASASIGGLSKQNANIGTASTSTEASNVGNHTASNTLVEIKNVPADIAPLVIQTIKAQKKLLSIIIKHRKRQSASATSAAAAAATAASINPTSNRRSSNHDHDDNNSNNATHDVLNRMARYEQNQQQQQILNDIPPEFKIQKENTIQSIKALLSRLLLEEKKQQNKNTYNDNNNNNQNNNNSNNNVQQFNNDVTFSCLIFILDLVKDGDNKLILRHAAILIASNIIHQSMSMSTSMSMSMSNNRNNHNTRIKECHLFLVVTYPMKKLIDSIGIPTSSRNDTSSNQIQHLHEWMKNQILYEIWKLYSLLSNYKLSSSSWTDEKRTIKDPRIIVTLRYLEEQKGVSIFNNTAISTATSTATSTSTESKSDEYSYLDQLILPDDQHQHQNQYQSQYQQQKSLIIERRHIRDVAIKYGERENKRVEKILNCINDCMEIIVPRFVGATRSDSYANVKPTGKSNFVSFTNESANCVVGTTSTTGTGGDVTGATTATDGNDDINDNNNNYNGHNNKHENSNIKDDDLNHDSGNIDDNNDEEDDIDWEDGDDEELLLISQEEEQQKQQQQQKQQLDKKNHISAVEHTLTMMKETGALNQEGGLEVNVNFLSEPDRQQNNDEDSNSDKNDVNTIENESESIKLARKKLMKCVQLLMNRHLPRLNAWINALITADNMTTANAGANNNHENLIYNAGCAADRTASVVLLPLSSRKKKGFILRMLGETRNQVTMGLALTEKLGIQSEIKSSITLATTTSTKDNYSGDKNLQNCENLELIRSKDLPGSVMTDRDENVDNVVQMIPWQKALGIQSVGQQKENAPKSEVSALPNTIKKKQIMRKGRLQIKLRKS